LKRTTTTYRKLLQYEEFSLLFNSLKKYEVVQMLAQQARQKEFSYYEFWALQEPQKKAHKQKAEEYGLIDEDDLPVASTLQIIRKSRDIIEDLTEEELTAWSEVQRQVYMRDIEPLLAIPVVHSDFIDLRQFEEIDGKMVDVSAFNTIDFLGNRPEFDKKRYAMNKIAEKAEDLALLHSCVSSKRGREHIKARFKALVNTSYRNRALYLANVKFQQVETAEKQAVIRQKVAECNRQIIRLGLIWKNLAFS